MRFAVPLLLTIGVFAQPSQTPHQLLEKVKKLGLSRKTIDQAEPLLEQAIQDWQDNDPRNPEFGETLTRLGMIRQFVAADDFQTLRSDVEPIYRHALEVYNRAATEPPPEELSLTLELEAATLNATGQVVDATPLANRAFSIRKQRIREMQEGEPGVAVAYKAGGPISTPVAVKKSEPEYTAEARFLKIQGTVEIRLVVDPQGIPRDISLLRSLGYGLDEQAVHAVRQWRFQPGAMEGGGVVPTAINLEVNFHLE